MEQFDGEAETIITLRGTKIQEAETIITLRGTNVTNSSYRFETNENVQ